MLCAPCVLPGKRCALLMSILGVGVGAEADVTLIACMIANVEHLAGLLGAGPYNSISYTCMPGAL